MNDQTPLTVGHILMARASTDFANTLRQWDQKSKTQIVEIYRSFKDTPGFLTDLLDFCQIEEFQGGATWLIKHHCEQTQVTFSPAGQREFYAVLGHLVSWDAQLHALQILPYVPIPSSGKADLKAFLNSGITHQNKLVRAWSYYGLALMAQRFADEAPRVLVILEEAAAQNPSGAVAVRLRKARALLR